MRYLSATAGFLLACIITLGASAETPAHPDYIEFTVHDLAKAKAFYGKVFGWSFTDYGPTYASFDDGKIGGGFTTDGAARSGGPLMVFYAADLDGTLKKIKDRNAIVLGYREASRPFSFTGDDGIGNLVELCSGGYEASVTMGSARHERTLAREAYLPELARVA